MGLKISLHLILVVWAGTSSCRIDVLTCSWNLLLEMSQTIGVCMCEGRKCVGWWLPVVTRQEVHKQGLLICPGQPTRLGKCLYLALEPEWKRPWDDARVTSSPLPQAVSSSETPLCPRRLWCAMSPQLMGWRMGQHPDQYCKD